MHTSYEVQPLGKWILDDSIIIDKKADLQVMIMIYKNDIFALTSSKSSDYTSKKSNESKT